jgi:hypothetical protein
MPDQTTETGALTPYGSALVAASEASEALAILMRYLSDPTVYDPSDVAGENAVEHLLDAARLVIDCTGEQARFGQVYGAICKALDDAE